MYAPLRDQLGLRRARLVYTGGAPLGPDTFRFFRAIGVNLKQVYGASELAGVCSAQPDGEVDPETVGRVFPGVEVRIDERRRGARPLGRRLQGLLQAARGRAARR